MRFYFPLHFFICSFVLSLICFSYAQLRHAVITSKATNKQTKNYNRQLCNECHCHRRCRGSSIPYAFDHRFHTQSHSTFAVWVYGSCSQNTPTKMYYLYMYRNYVYMTIGRVFKRFRFLVESKIFIFVVAKTG